MNVEIISLVTSGSWFLTGVYGSPQAQGRLALWDGLREIARTCDKPCLVMGDFNAYSYAIEKNGGSGPNFQSMQMFNNCLFDYGLSDVDFKGPPFTWE